jgi:hypothetical protein
MKSENSPVAAVDPQVFPPAVPLTGKNGSLTTEQGQGEDADYAPVPARKAVIVSVAYRIRGRGQPLPYHLEEDDGE